MLIAGLFAVLCTGYVRFAELHMTGSFAEGIKRTYQHIVDHYADKPDYQGLTTDVAMTFTTVPVLSDLSVQSYTTLVPNDSFVLAVNLAELGCRGIPELTFGTFAKVLINGQQAKTAGDLAVLCAENDNQVEMISAAKAT